MCIEVEEAVDEAVDEAVESWELKSRSFRRIGVVSQIPEPEQFAGWKLGMIWSNGEGDVDKGGEAGEHVDEDGEVPNWNTSEWML